MAAPDVDRIVERAFGKSRGRTLQLQLLTDGFRNANYKLQFNGGSDWFVVRIYEHDATLCQKEMDLIRLVHGSVPVPDLIHAEPHGLDGLAPFAVLRYAEGISFRDLARTVDQDAIAQAAFSAGKTLAAIGSFVFSRGGWLGPGPEVTGPGLSHG